MIRKLAFALALVNLGFTGLVHALGLGEAEVTSSLNQPLRAEIELVSTKGLQETEILPGLATREEFLKAGVDRVYFLSDLRFKVERNSQGNMVVILTTNKPVREPFLNFLVEVIWPSGRLLREYALLIDPPTFAQEPPAPVAAPVIQPRSQPQSQVGDSVAMPAPVTKTPVRSSVAPGTYGPTNSRDTLWDIAVEARPNRSVSHQQVMLAIQDLNPDAFIGNNINRMKAGQVLRLPTLDQIKARSSATAIEQVIAQNQALKPKKKKSVVSAAKTVQSPSKPATSSSGNELKLVVAEEAATTSSSTANSGGDATAGAGRGLDTKLAVTLEKLDKSALENNELSGRVEDLEEQLATLQRLLTLKNDQLSGLQAQSRAAELAKLTAEQEAQAGVQEQVETDSAVATLSDQTPVDESGAAAQNAADVDVNSEEIADEVVDDGASEKSMAGNDIDATSEKSEVEESMAATSSPEEPVKTAPAARQEGIFEQIMNNPLYQGLVAIGLLLLLVILWFVSKQNAKAEQAAQDSVADDVSDDSFDSEEASYDEGGFDEDSSEEFEAVDALDEVDASASAGDDETAEAHDSQEEDVIAEADVYIAYGRLDQAASVLEQGVSSDPVRSDYRLKLLEVYAETADVEAFERQLSELEAIQDPDAMARALEIKAAMVLPDETDDSDSDDLEVGETHFEQGQAEALDADSETDREPDNSFDFESVALDEEDDDDDDLGIDLSSEDLELDLDIDLDSDSAAVDYESEEVAISEGDDAGASVLELDDADLDAAMAELDDVESLSLSEDDDLADAALDLELGDIELSDELEQESEIELPEDLSLPDDLLGLDDDDSEPQSVAPEQGSGEAEVVSDDILDEATEALGGAEEFDADLGDEEDFDFLNGTDEASTKLDLARAYIDMGDVDGARDILLEVEKEGSSEQQADAKSLLDSL